MSDRDTITLPREVVQFVLKHLEWWSDDEPQEKEAIEALRTALAAEPTKQEALCWFCHGTGYQKNPVYPALVPCPNCKPKEYFK